ncbi:hypothetical protein EX895_001599 [Sporisorium graminicola]|uniref:JmjC domain-containing protein n=1 Tax=Sporisorium graminicola TaxID=280036 RepID=A0A4U7KZZ9_9BASI|nr:hypothetical protein EX895_001599 [Sporisorium graminicola]TKY89068.1 hypothetical protein EX895_001599 [Sporisorium graminicola]
MYEGGLELIIWAEQHRSKESGQFHPAPPLQKTGLAAMFETKPKLGHAFQELLSSDPSNIIMFSSNQQLADDEITVAQWLASIFVHKDSYEQTYDPFTAIVPKPMQHGGGLRACLPKSLEASLFPRLSGLSNYTLFLPERSNLFFSAAGALTTIHVDVGTMAGVSTLIAGAKLFVVFKASEKSFAMMQQYHLLPMTWSACLKLVRQLEEPSFHYLRPGESLYIGTGQPHFFPLPLPFLP